MPEDFLSQPPVPAAERIHYGEAPSQFYDIFGIRAASQGVASPSIIMIHGGFWRSRYDLTHASHLCAALAQTGLTVASFEYRRVGESGGGWPGTFDDIVAAFRHVVKESAPVVMGHSAGGHLALLLAAQKLPLAPKGVLALAPVACLERARDENLGAGAVAAFMGTAPYAPADPVQHSSAVPRVLVHGAEDDVVPLSHSRAYVAARQGDPGQVRLVEVPAADHFDLIDPASRAWPIVLANVKQLLL